MKQTLGICLIGAGRAGMIHGRNFASRVKGAKMVAVVDALESACHAACEELGISKYYLDYKEALKDPEVDAVVIVSPTGLHKQIAIDAANAKKHIFCEKPMAVDVEECQAMIDAAEQNGVKLQIAFMRRHDESFEEAKKAIDAGEIGDVPTYFTSCG